MKNYLLILGASLMFTGCSSSTYTTQAIPDEMPNYLSTDQAKNIAFKHSGTVLDKVKHLEIEFDMYKNQPVYEIDWKEGVKKYEYHIDAVTGNIYGFDIDIDID